MENERDNEFMDESDVDPNANAAEPAPDQQQQPEAVMHPGSVSPPQERRPGEIPRMAKEASTQETQQPAEAPFARNFRLWRMGLDTDMIGINSRDVITAVEGQSADDVRTQLKHNRYLEEFREVSMRAKYLEKMTEGILPGSLNAESLAEEREMVKETLQRVSLARDLQILRVQVAELKKTDGVGFGRNRHAPPPGVEGYAPSAPIPRPGDVPSPPQQGLTEVIKDTHELLDQLDLRLMPLCVGSPGSSSQVEPEGPACSELLAMAFHLKYRLRDLMDRMVVI